MDYYISFGSNIAPRENIRQMMALLREEAGVALIKSSKIYETEPWGFTDQDGFLNGVLLLRSTLTPLSMLKKMQELEKALGRERVIKWGPRTIDLDIVWMEEDGVAQQWSSDELAIPHPYFWERTFVLEPLAEIYPDFRYGEIDIRARIKELRGED